jgi:hypothetical protein
LLQERKRLCIQETPSGKTDRVDLLGRQTSDGQPRCFNTAKLAEQAMHRQGAGQCQAVYDERVRKKAEREAMPAWDCPKCAHFFAAMECDGVVLPQDAVNCNDCGVGTKAARAADLRQAAGKHRCNHVAPATPKNFWALGLTSERE